MNLILYIYIYEGKGEKEEKKENKINNKMKIWNFKWIFFTL